MNNILIDIDGTVSEVIPCSESHRFKDAKVINGAVSSINHLYDSGNIITFVTIRPEAYREITENWLKSNGFKYNSLIMNKTKANQYYWINNLNVQGIKYDNNWESITNRLQQIPEIENMVITSPKKYRTIYDLQGGVNYII